MVKIYSKGNYLVIEENSIQLWIPKAKVSVTKNVLSTGTFYRFLNQLTDAERIFKSDDIVDSAGVAHTDLEGFLTTNTGA